MVSNLMKYWGSNAVRVLLLAIASTFVLHTMAIKNYQSVDSNAERMLKWIGPSSWAPEEEKYATLVQKVVDGFPPDNILADWDDYIGRLTEAVKTDLVGEPMSPMRQALMEKHLKVLVVTAVSNDEWVVDNFADNFNKLNSAGAKNDIFDFAFFHHHVNDSRWVSHSWYKREAEKGRVVMNVKEQGCKPQYWRKITSQMVSEYDYIWLLDEDLRLDYFSWDLYRTFLIAWGPVVSQPSVIPRLPVYWPTPARDDPVNVTVQKATKVRSVAMEASEPGSGLLVAKEVSRSEVMTPFIDARLWSSIVKRIGDQDDSADWGLDAFWDSFAGYAKWACGKNNSLKINVLPVRHMNYHNLQTSKAKCQSSFGPDNINCHIPTKSDDAIVMKALTQICPNMEGDKVARVPSEHWATMVSDEQTKTGKVDSCPMDVVRRDTWTGRYMYTTPMKLGPGKIAFAVHG